MRGLQHHKRDICFLNNSAKTANLRELFIEAFFASMPLPIDVGFFGPFFEPETPQNNELQNRNELQWEAGLNFICEKTGYEQYDSPHIGIDNYILNVLAVRSRHS